MTGWGLLLLDKPEGITSHTAVRRAARALGLKKAGHAGTLDPMASGLMLVGLGRATRLLEYWVGCDKSYRATVRLGEERDTLDREGALVRSTPVEAIDREALEQQLERFRGTFEQLPPVYSAIKVAGVAMHRRVRRGEEVTPAPRTVTISRLVLVEVATPEFTLELDCSSGAYVRSLARDLGDGLGMGGALWALRRTRCGPFTAKAAVTLDELEALGEAGWSQVLPPERMVEPIPRRTLTEEERTLIVTGRPIALSGGETAASDQALLAPDDTLIALARARDGALWPRKVFV